jgi:hypothetical protein
LGNSFVLNQSQLTKRAKDILNKHFNSSFKIHYVALTYSPDISIIDNEWIKEKKAKYKISNNDIIKHLNIDKSTLSLFLSGNRGLTKSQKSAFLFYFLQYEINNNLRDHIEKLELKIESLIK